MLTRVSWALRALRKECGLIFSDPAEENVQTLARELPRAIAKIRFQQEGKEEAQNERTTWIKGEAKTLRGGRVDNAD